MPEVRVQVVNPLGLHARAASRLAECAARFDSDITVARGDRSVDGKSILALLTLAAAQHTELILSADGPDAETALSMLTALVEDGFGELT